MWCHRGSYVTSFWSQKRSLVKNGMRYIIWIPMHFFEKRWKCPHTVVIPYLACSSAPVQMSLGIHFCSRSLPRIRQQWKHLLNRSDTVLSCSLSLSFILISVQQPLQNSMKFPSEAVVCPSVHFKICSTPNASNTAFLSHYFCTFLMYLIKNVNGWISWKLSYSGPMSVKLSGKNRNLYFA